MQRLAMNASAATMVAMICMFFLIMYDKVFTTTPGAVVLFLLACTTFLCDKNVGILVGIVFLIFVLYARNNRREGMRKIKKKQLTLKLLKCSSQGLKRGILSLPVMPK